MSIITPAELWPHIKALIPNMPASTERFVITVEPDAPVKVEATFAALGPDGQIKFDHTLGEIERRTEQFALIPFGEARPPSEREAFVAELIEFARRVERSHDIAFASGSRMMTGDKINGTFHSLFNDVGNQATRLIRKHEGKA